MRKRTLSTLAGTAGLILALTACSGDGGAEPPVEEVDASDFAEGSTMASLAEAGTIRIGTKFDQPLFGLDDGTGNPQGFDVEIGKIIAGELGIEPGDIEWVLTESVNREPFIENGEVDIVIATYTINDTRKEVVSFAGPYYEAGQALLVPEGNPEGITGPEDLEGKPVCTVGGSTSEQNILEYGADVTALNGYADCLDPLRNGQVVALTTDNVILSGYVDQNPGEFQLVADEDDNPVLFTEEPYGIGLALDDTDFREWINDVLEASYEDGRWDAAWEATAGAVLPLPEAPAVDRY
ncbi:glutamate ABC transporter substrate-binding protein [Arenivirga flava]|uniref:Glutamate-binding protein n=1 Tax=Arenivirga flava TaxID=1930060 RepID=A0AA37UAD4_9MICO|nr:glutamate ABC transporter substrate-binding protein [Arenivirga flava]GMA27108.1 glutamate-binding protein [Arenivirga flava]